MNINSIIKERTKRLYSLPRYDSLVMTRDLLACCRPDGKIIPELRQAVLFFLHDCLTTYFKNKEFALIQNLEEFVALYENDIIELPNITPNGLILPKREILMSYNHLLKKVVELVKNLDLDQTCSKVACPVNLRLNFGTRMKEQFKQRPKSSTIWHTDIWAGQNAQEVMLHTPIFGNFGKNGILLANPPEGFFPDYIKNLDSFVDGKPITDQISTRAYNPQMQIGRAYIVDSFLLHKTLNMDDSFRGIISFPLRPQEKVESDIYHNEDREPEYYPMEEWVKLGTSRVVITDKKLEKYTGEDTVRHTYADKFETVAI